jgi:hypothetical protein
MVVAAASLPGRGLDKPNPATRRARIFGDDASGKV